MENVKKDLEKIIEGIVAEAGCYTVGFNVNLQGSRTFVRLIVESISGITLDEITDITRKINENAEIDQIMADGYQLEVTSPGAEHPLKEYRDFPRNLGRKIKVFHTSKAMKSPLKGDLIDVQEDKIVISINGVAQEIFFTELDYAKVVLKW
ncbi:MAG: hypothetical protein J7L86_04155 [Candidatus Marinimicrobia bacterium]|nr:hypothetical protein [Candidatus Neomarinimicrobiota bacterium]